MKSSPQCSTKMSLKKSKMLRRKKKVDVSSAPTSKKTTAVKKTFAKNLHPRSKEYPKSVPVEQVGELEDAFAKDLGHQKRQQKAQKDDLVQHNAEQATNKRLQSKPQRRRSHPKKSKQEQPKKNTNDLFHRILLNRFWKGMRFLNNQNLLQEQTIESRTLNEE